MTQGTILERVVASLAALALFAAIIKSFMLAVRMRRARRSVPQDLLAAEGTKNGGPTLLYFWSDGCGQCAPQERQIDEAKKILKNAGASLTVVKLNALEEEKLASSMRVMTVPTTVVLDGEGYIRAWNPGLTPARTLAEQFVAVGAAP